MFARTRNYFASFFVAGAMALGGVVTLDAQKNQQDGLINVAVGNITITDAVDIGVAAAIAANICGVKVGPVAVLGRAVDRSGDAAFVCNSASGPVTLVQN